MKKIIYAILTFLMVISIIDICSINCFAASNDGVIVFGADLTDSQKEEVLTLFGISPEDISNYSVLSVTNSEEHEYLDAYYDSSVIGDKAITSVLVTKANAGDGVNVTTYNINYFSTGMYSNALITAGVEDCNVIVAAPFEVSGSAGLIGAIKAYELLENKTVSDSTVDTAVDEMITTAEISFGMNSVDSKDIEALISWLKSMVASGKLNTSNEESIKNTISEGEKKFNVTLNDSEKVRLIELLKKLDSMGLNGSYLISQAEKLYKEYGADIVNHTSEAIGEAVDNAVTQAGQSFWQSMKKSVVDFFTGFFNR